MLKKVTPRKDRTTVKSRAITNTDPRSPRGKFTCCCFERSIALTLRIVCLEIP